MADAVDSKSTVGDNVRVQVPLPALKNSVRYRVFSFALFVIIKISFPLLRIGIYH